jgi:hypothetical protein
MTLGSDERRRLEEAHRRTVDLLDNNCSKVGQWRKTLFDNAMMMDSFNICENNPLSIILDGPAREAISQLRKRDGTAVKPEELTNYTFVVGNLDEAQFTNDLWRKDMRS